MSPFQFDNAMAVGFEFGGLDDTGRPIRLPLTNATAQWLAENFREDRLFGMCKSPYLAARNSAIRDVVLPHSTDCEWAVFVDNDVTVTHPGVQQFLAAEGDVVACTCKMRQADAWNAPGAFHTPFWRCRIEVLKAIEPPWFEYPYSPDGCDLLGCDCMEFARKVIGAGFSIAHAGHCGHACTGTWC